LMAVAQEEEEAARGEIVDRIGPFGRRPLLVPRDFSAGFIPELLDLDQLFLGSRSSGPSDGPMAQVTGFDRSYGELIAFDDFGAADTEVDFKDALMEEPLAALAPATADDFGLPLCGTLFAGNCVRDDDFSGSFVIESDPQPIPEPGSAALMVLGILGLAWQGRRARRWALRV
ncbi:MAG: PEP-CTERM sorting domain-containing protein, partial [Myxococcota bacterium]